MPITEDGSNQIIYLSQLSYVNMLPTFFVCGLLLLGQEIVATTITSPEVLHLERRLSSNSTNPTSSHNIELNATQFGQRFDIEVKLGNESFLLLVDTGSSDLWVIAGDWQCIDNNNNAHCLERPVISLPSLMSLLPHSIRSLMSSLVSSSAVGVQAVSFAVKT